MTRAVNAGNEEHSPTADRWIVNSCLKIRLGGLFNGMCPETNSWSACISAISVGRFRWRTNYLVESIIGYPKPTVYNKPKRPRNSQ